MCAYTYIYKEYVNITYKIQYTTLSQNKTTYDIIMLAILSNVYLKFKQMSTVHEIY